MSGHPRIQAGRLGVNAQTGALVDKSFDSDNDVQKIVKAKRRTTTGAITHGVNYSCEYLLMREVSATIMANVREDYSDIDTSNINGTIRQHIDTMDNLGTYTYADDDALWGYNLLNPIGTPEADFPFLKRTFPRIVVGDVLSPLDYNKKIYTPYDTFKVKETGNLAISKGVVTYHHGDAGLIETTTVTYDHNLGYKPMFSPFVDYEISLPIYINALEQWRYRNVWTTSTEYGLTEKVNHPTKGDIYQCIKTHTSSATNKPLDGVDSALYWELVKDYPPEWVTSHAYSVGDYVTVYEFGSFSIYQCSTAHTSGAGTKPTSGGTWYTKWDDVTFSYFDNSYDINLNELEDLKFSFGGISVFNDYIVRFYVTDTQIVLQLVRVTFDWEDPSIGLANDPLVATDISVDFTIFYNRADEEMDLLI